jgi:hypothetical protein
MHLHGIALQDGTWFYPNCLGASGAVTAVLVMAAFINPRLVIYMFMIIPVPIWVFVILNVAADAFSLFGRAAGGVATSAHLTGAAFGFLYYKLQWRLSAWTSIFSGLARARKRPKLRVYREEEETPTPKTAPRAATTPAPRVQPDEQLEAQMDMILEKIQRVGMDGLTDKERQVLLRASEAIKRRRS